MFERFTEPARRVFFFARYEASVYGSTSIETEHFLMGLFREDKNLIGRFLGTPEAAGDIRKEIEARTTIREKVSTSIDLPLSVECKRIVAYALEEAQRLDHLHISTEHFLLGILREENCMAARILHERGLRLSAIREELAHNTSAGFPVGQDPPPEGGVVPDEDTAIRIAEAVWIPIHGLENVEAQRPLKARLSNDGCWAVTGSLNVDQQSVPFFAMIRRDDGKILNLTRKPQG